jgi:hypothetical protein
MFGKKATPDISSNILFNQVSYLNLKFTPNRKEFLDLKEGSTIYKMEDKADCIYLIMDGQIKIKSKDQDDYINIDYRNKNELFGEVEYFEELPQRRSSVVALTNVKLYRLNNESLKKLINTNEQILKNLKNHKIEYSIGELHEKKEDIDLRPWEDLPGGNKNDEFIETKDVSSQIDNNPKDDDLNLAIHSNDALWSDEENELHDSDLNEEATLENVDEPIYDDDKLPEENSGIDQTNSSEFKIEGHPDDPANRIDDSIEKKEEIIEDNEEENSGAPQTDSPELETKEYTDEHADRIDESIEKEEEELKDNVLFEEDFLLKDETELSDSEVNEQEISQESTVDDDETSDRKSETYFIEPSGSEEENYDDELLEHNINSDEIEDVKDEDTDSEDVQWFEESEAINDSNIENKNEPEKITEEINDKDGLPLEVEASSPSESREYNEESVMDKDYAGENEDSIKQDENAEKELEPVSEINVLNKEYDFSDNSVEQTNRFDSKSEKEMILNLNQFLYNNMEHSNQIIGKYLNFINANDITENARNVVTQITREVQLNQQYLSSVTGLLKEKINLNLEQKSLNDTLNNILPKLAEYSSENNVQIYKKLNEDVFVEIDEAKFYQACFQIVKNSCEAMEKQEKIFVSTHVSENEVEIVFKDSGLGIPESIQDEIFEPYFSHGKNSAGLGLTLAKKIITEHRGKISVTSAIGEGTSVTITLPHE